MNNIQIVEEVLKEQFFDGDFRRNPKTKIFCAYCQKDLDTSKIKYWAFLKDQNIINPLFIHEHPKKEISVVPIGNECAKHLGKEWLITRDYTKGLLTAWKNELEFLEKIFKWSPNAENRIKDLTESIKILEEGINGD